MDNLLQSIENEMKHIDEIRGRLIQPKKIQLHPNIDGFDSPETYGIYRHTGGKALGVVGSQFEPMDLNQFLDAVVYSATQAGLDLSGLKYNEYKDGSKIIFDLPLKEYELKTKLAGDVTKTKLQFKTGFDGLTKISLGFYSYRLWCANGCGNWGADTMLSFKNTYGNKAKVMLFTNEIIETVANTDKYINQLNELATKPVTQVEMDAFFLAVTGTTIAKDKEISTRKRNILDAINESVAIEFQNTGANWFSLLQGITRYTTHDMANGDEEAILFNAAAKYNQTAHKLAFANLS